MCIVSTKTLSTIPLGRFFLLHPEIAHDDHQGPNYYLAILHFMLSLIFGEKNNKARKFYIWHHCSICNCVRINEVSDACELS
jgi:hypothetical protein